METLLRHRGYVVLTLVYVILFGGYVLYEHRPQLEPVEIVEPTVAPTLAPAPIQVHVAGAVRRPGVYTLPAGSRLLQAVEAAGGLTEAADEEAVNLADYVRDGQQVHIAGRGTPSAPRPTSMTAESAGAQGLVNINTATAAELESLPGIGKAYAERIIAYRQEHGPFTDPAQIMEVKGIGPARYEQIRLLITVR
jgi:competence protein ComEA